MPAGKDYARPEKLHNRKMKLLLREGKLFRCGGCGILHETRDKCDDCQRRGPVPPWAREVSKDWQ